MEAKAKATYVRMSPSNRACIKGSQVSNGKR